MTADHVQPATNAPPVTLDSVLAEKKYRVIRPPIHNGFLPNDTQVGFRNIEATLIVFSYPLQELLSGAERKRYEPMEHDSIPDHDGRNDHGCADNKRQSIAKAVRSL